MKGELIGINALILSRGGGSEGISFAILSNMAKTVKDRLLGNAGVYTRATTGAAALLMMRPGRPASRFA
jgi:S1-C subfamily serine protease